MASVKVAPKAPLAFENRPSKPRDDSFSTYLALVRENFPPELGNSAPERLSCRISLGTRRTLDGEIEIFDAEKYFSGVMDSDAPPQAPENGPEKPTKKEVRVRVRSRSRTGSISSEMTCNSRNTLLRDRRKHPVPGGKREVESKRFLGVFPCSCARKDAIDIDKDALSHARSDGLRKQLPQAGERRDENLVSDSRLKRISPGLRQQVFASREERKGGGGPRVVFAPDFFDTASTHRRSLKIASGGEGGRDDDVQSEASSDLFEIESLSMTSSHPFITHEGTESVTTTAYEPSEASVEWSVVTRSVANFSIASERVAPAASLRKTRRSSGSGLLLGCVSEKAVDVTSGAKKPTGSSSFDHWEHSGIDGAARFRAESCGVDVGSGSTGRVLPPSPFGSSRSSHDP
ncbi:hypothetical protein C4D60_Mb10t05310 [Musa balbisiana]|uniref:Uncharacterized protein n=1 Tax=Musa balbisiana TaxID=52838 RepID=A0A4V4H4K4_MUSBA|nr:hypothetical protein C4D60_Mb10t05310 [Musa balbisiana]